LAILANVLLQANVDTGKIDLTAFDLSLGIQTQFNAQVETPGEVTLPAKLLGEIITRLPEGEITLECDTESETSDWQTTITSASGRFTIRGIDAAEYPQLPKVSNGTIVKLPVRSLLDGLSGSLFAASSAEIKQVLAGVHLTYQADCLEFAATDGHRLAVAQTPLIVDGEDQPVTLNPELNDFEITIPARAFRELERMLSGYDDTDTITLASDQTQAVFELDHQILTTRKIEGNYPAYHRLIPTQFNIQATVERKRLLNSLELVAVLADQSNNFVKCLVDSSGGQLCLSVDAPDLGSAKQVLPAQISGGDMEIGFNAKYLAEGLKALPTTDITMQLNDSAQPVIFTPLGGMTMTYLVMPMQLKN
jgi:DNA polymerase-3 subunit beta